MMARMTPAPSSGATSSRSRLDSSLDRREREATSRWFRLPAQVARASEIATVLWSSGFRWLVAALGLRSCVSAGCRLFCATRLRQCEHHVGMERPLPDRMRLVLERLGPTFVKVGQVVALRPDYVPLEYAQALRRLHDHVAPFQGRDAQRVVEEELGRPLGTGTDRDAG